MKKTYLPTLIAATAVLLTIFAFTTPSQSTKYDYMIIEYNDYYNNVYISTTTGLYSTRNVKTLLLDKTYDRTPFLSEIKNFEAAGWELYDYTNFNRSSAGMYSCMMRKPAN